MAHSLGEGTDGLKLWMDVLAALCTVAVGSALAWRIADHRRNRRRAARVGALTRAVPARPTPHRLTAGSSPVPARPDRVTSASDLLTKERP